jgi:ribosomal protein L3 glutamine methyltransferase
MVNTIKLEQAISTLMTVEDCVRWAASRFCEHGLFFGHGCDDPWDEAVMLVMHGLHLPMTLGQQVRQTRITLDEKKTVLALIQQRIERRIPAPYLIQEAWFCGLSFYVDERVLIPRSPIAELIEQQFSTLLPTDNPPQRILDLCTGSACIAIACAYAFPDAEVDAIDISSDALAVAQHNIEAHGCLERVFPMQSDGFQTIPAGTQYDLIVTNPPYVDAEDLASMPAEFQHEPAVALGSGTDGLHLTKTILAQAASFLAPDGILVVEVGNSMVHLIQQYPAVPFQWLSFDRGGDGVFCLTRAQLVQHFSSDADAG